ncbi:MAG TPA: S1C family serine protease [Acidimicrobiales bacterium]|nr:S1C family serine protease [Acidimicrobiales bacterium]
MDAGGTFAEGELPDDPAGLDDDEVGPRGWLPPDDRLWRHPSEVGRLGPPRRVPSLFDTVVGWPPRRVRGGALTAGVVGVVAMAATVAVVLSVVDTSSGGSPLSAGRDVASGVEVSTTSMTTVGLSRDVMQLVDAVRPSLVDLVPTGAGDEAGMTGVVLPGGDLVVTAASAVAGASHVDVVTANGRRRRGVVVGTDAGSGVAVVSTAGGMAPATFADEDIQPDDLAVVACLCRTAAAVPVGASAGVGMVTEVGTGVAVGGTDLADAIEAELPLGPSSRGGVLLDSRGRVIGILDGTTSSGDDPMGVFVPAPLAESVALELAQTHHLDHGWLGIVCSDQPGAAGATVTEFLPGSPAAAAGLRSGDVVVAVGPHPVASVADLQQHLYADPPGTTVQLSVVRGEDPLHVSVTLASAPAS